MDAFSIVSVVGALAWLPPIISAISRAVTKTRIQVITSKDAEIGFSSFGPIINLRVAFSAEHRDIVLSSLSLKVRHESGELREFYWQGITQNLGRINNPGVGTIPYEKENSVLAIKIDTRNVEERFIRFQDEKYLAQKKELYQRIRRKLIYLNNTEEYDPDKILKSEEFGELLRFNQQGFNWKIGRYDIQLVASAKSNFTMINSRYHIFLDQLDIETLNKNIEYNKMAYVNEIKAGTPGYEFVEIQWNWVNPTMNKSD